MHLCIYLSRCTTTDSVGSVLPLILARGPDSNEHYFFFCMVHWHERIGLRLNLISSNSALSAVIHWWPGL
uniref:Uncharacterized protein n=1 Tax=Rhizophora mucronata TaxID=61149 RepID=A0A2P2NFQ3_RHIMU